MRAQASPGVRRPAGRSTRIGAPAAASGSATERIANAAPSRTARASSARPWPSVSPTNAPRASLVEQRRPLAREVGQEHQPARARPAPRRPPPAASSASTAPGSTSSRSQSTDAPRAAIAPPTTHRPGNGAGATNSPSASIAPVGVDARARPTRRPCPPRRPAHGGPRRACVAVPSLTPATTGIPARRPSASAASGRSSPSRDPNARARGHDRRPARRRPAASPRPTPSRAPGATSPPRPTATGRARPTPRAATRPARRTAGSSRASHAIVGSSPNPPDPPAVGRRSCHVIAGRTGSPDASTTASVGPCPTPQIASTSSRGRPRSIAPPPRPPPTSRPADCSARPSAPTSIG